MHYTICDYISDIAYNSIEAASALIIVDIIEEGSQLAVYIADNGKGMDAETLTKVKDPFFSEEQKHKDRKVGLGIPFLIQTTQAANGSFDIKSRKDFGTSVHFGFDLTNVDTPPLGNMVSTLMTLLTYPGDYEMIINRQTKQTSYSLCKSELIETLGELDSSVSLNLLKKYIQSLEDND